MLSSFVFTVGALGLIALIYSSAEGVTASQKITQATTLARNKLDELLRTPYDDSALAVGEYEEASNIDASGAAVAGDFGANDGNFARSWQVALPDATVGFKTINVRVRWWDGTKDMERSINVAAGKSE